MSENDFTRVYLDTYKDLCLLALRYVHSTSVAEDIVQDSFCKVLVRRPELFLPENGSQIRAYMWRVVRNRSIDWCRRNDGRSLSLEERLLESELSLLVDELVAPDSFNAHDYGLILSTIGEAVTEMPPRAREVYLLRRENGLSNKDVAEKLGVSVKAVEKQMTISLRRLRHAFREKGIPFILLIAIFLGL